MDDVLYLQRVRAALVELEDSCTDAEHVAGLRLLKAETGRRLQAAAFPPPVVFDLRMPGYATIGEVGRLRTLVLPDLEGVHIAHQVLGAVGLLGAAVHSVLRAEDLLARPGARPANALRNALAGAANWLERDAGCPRLAAAVRSPALRVSQDGRIAYARPKGLRVLFEQP